MFFKGPCGEFFLFFVEVWQRLRFTQNWAVWEKRAAGNSVPEWLRRHAAGGRFGIRVFLS